MTQPNFRKQNRIPVTVQRPLPLLRVREGGIKTDVSELSLGSTKLKTGYPLDMPLKTVKR